MKRDQKFSDPSNPLDSSRADGAPMPAGSFEVATDLGSMSPEAAYLSICDAIHERGLPQPEDQRLLISLARELGLNPVTSLRLSHRSMKDLLTRASPGPGKANSDDAKRGDAQARGFSGKGTAPFRRGLYLGLRDWIQERHAQPEVKHRLLPRLASILGVPSGFTGGLRESGFATRPRSSRDRASPDVFDETKISRDSNPVQAPLDEGLVRAWEAHCSRGGKLFANHDLDAARLEYESALEIARSVLHSHPQFGSTYQELGVILQAQGDHESAAKLYEEALELFREVHGVGATQTTNLRKSLVSAIREEAWSLHESGQKRAAEWRYRRAIEFADEIDSPNIWLGVCLKELAFILKSLGRHAEAEPLYDRVLPIFEEFYGEADPEVKSARRGLVAVMREIAWEHYRSNNEERAEHKYRETLVIARSLGASDIWLGHTLNELAIVLNSRGAHQEAESHYTSALEIFEGEYGLLHRNVVSILNRLVALQIANGQACRAQAIGERVLAAEESDPTACVRSLLTIGETLLDGKQADLAEWMFARVDERLPPEPLLDPEWRRLRLGQAASILDLSGRASLELISRVMAPQVTDPDHPIPEGHSLGFLRVAEHLLELGLRREAASLARALLETNSPVVSPRKGAVGGIGETTFPDFDVRLGRILARADLMPHPMPECRRCGLPVPSIAILCRHETTCSGELSDEVLDATAARARSLRQEGDAEGAEQLRHFIETSKELRAQSGDPSGKSEP